MQRGVIEAGKKTEIGFEYLPDSMELHESFWRFYIQEQNVSVSFLLVGAASDPQVSLDKSHLNFKELLIGLYPCLCLKLAALHTGNFPDTSLLFL